MSFQIEFNASEQNHMTVLLSYIEYVYNSEKQWLGIFFFLTIPDFARFVMDLFWPATGTRVGDYILFLSRQSVEGNNNILNSSQIETRMK